ncbi:MAG TPA: ATP-dependent helicase, partial [Methanolinea sp.]|nr:ATP-dependent helicase [Methanolinea sp.]
QDPEYYIHRIGRTGRAGKSGKAFTFVSGKEMWKLRDIQKFAKIRIARHAVPADEDLRERRIVNMIGKIRENITAGDLEPYIARVEQVMGDEHTSLEVAAALFRMQSGADAGVSRGKGRGK